MNRKQLLDVGVVVAAAAGRVAVSPYSYRVILSDLYLLSLNEQRPRPTPFHSWYLYLKVVCNNLLLYGLVGPGIVFTRALMCPSYIWRRS